MARFISRYYNHTLVMEPADADKRKPGKRIGFVQGVYETEDMKEIKFIRECSDFGTSIVECEEVRSVGSEPKKLEAVGS
ncbi:hypothetical protein [uncultured Halomonas sp.]|jgi:hypothetical protein|uniref:hypothetical protein n=1 Tax=uncultured Halomonas sp. TaxID=173971 RepID=UPI00260F8132|nr:hypothetical protein [uncultured Halomonas sp.]